jgi:Domain of unknown function (DUF4124)
VITLASTFTFSRKLAWMAVVAAIYLAGGHAQAQTYFKCTDATGKVHFTDTGCGTMTGVPLAKSAGTNLPERKAQNDARVERDRALANRLESDRLGNEQAARAVQARQLEVDREVAGRVYQEREARKASTISILPPTECSMCR